jgi:hypothetical protein
LFSASESVEMVEWAGRLWVNVIVHHIPRHMCRRYDLERVKAVEGIEESWDFSILDLGRRRHRGGGD